jgi:hypothetical protein
VVQHVKRRPNGYEPEHQLRELASAASEAANTLDLVHVTKVGWAVKIIQTGLLQTNLCSVFKEKFVYFFVGRPEYRAHDAANGSDQISRFPAVFVVKPDNLGTPAHIYPFDTGAAWKGRFGDAVDPTVWLVDYELEKSVRAIKRHIAWAFGSNANYVDGNVKSEIRLSLPQWKTVAHSFFKIAATASVGTNRPDRRASAIEVAYREHVRLQNNAWLVVLPKQFLESDGDGSKNVPLIEVLQALRIEYGVYDWRPGETPDFYASEIKRLVRKRLTEKGQI